jgi:hypothetical protein
VGHLLKMTAVLRWVVGSTSRHRRSEAFRLHSVVPSGQHLMITTPPPLSCFAVTRSKYLGWNLDENLFPVAFLMIWQQAHFPSL